MIHFLIVWDSWFKISFFLFIDHVWLTVKILSDRDNTLIIGLLLLIIISLWVMKFAFTRALHCSLSSYLILSISARSILILSFLLFSGISSILLTMDFSIKHFENIRILFHSRYMTFPFQSYNIPGNVEWMILLIMIIIINKFVNIEEKVCNLKLRTFTKTYKYAAFLKLKFYW
mgnify:CR=1 FL=1